MTVYVSVPQVPLSLRFEESYDDVLEHVTGLSTNGSVHRYDAGDAGTVVVNFGVIAAITVSEGHRTLEPSELHRALEVTTGSRDA